MKLRVVISSSESSHSAIHEFSSAYCLVGRKNATLLVDDPRCSQQHLLLYEGPDGRLWVRDLDSTNGTFLNGKRVVEKALALGDSLRVGKTSIAITSYSPARESSLTHAGVNPSDVAEERTEVQRIGKRRPRKVEDGLVVNRWPDNLRASPQSFQDRFIDYVDEKGEMTRMRLKDLLKAA